MNAVWTNPGNHAKLMKIYEHSEIQEEKVKILNGLIYSKDTKVIIKTLDYCLTEKVRFSNVFYVLSGAADNPFAKQLVLDWLISNWNEFKKRIGGHGGTLLRKFVKIVVPICAIEHPEKAKKFLIENKTSGLEKTFLQVQEELEIHLNFIKRNK